MNKVILHSDLNNFYASVECLYNPKIRRFPVAVCGDIELRHGIVLAKNQIAKEIQVWLGHSDFAITANTYAHLDFNSKLASADKMAWINNTSLASEKEITPFNTVPPDLIKVSQEYISSIHALPKFINSLKSLDIPSEDIQVWLKQADLTSAESFEKSFKDFIIHSMQV